LEYLLENGCTAIVRPSARSRKSALPVGCGQRPEEISARAAAIGEDVKKLSASDILIDAKRLAFGFYL
jgi:hypothetical protein